MEFYWLVLGSLAVWRVTHLLNAEDGPWDLLANLRKWLGTGVWGNLLDCFYCLSLWIAAPFAYYLGAGWKERLLLWPALSGAACLVEGLTLHEGQAPPAPYAEDKEVDGVLRQEQDTIPARNFEPPAP